MSLLDCEDELLALAGEVEIAYFPEASSATVAGPYDLSLVEGSITTAGDRERILRCAGPRGAWSRSARARRPAESRRSRTSPTSTNSSRSSTPSPQYIETLATSTPISSHVAVDFELHGCPIDKYQLIEVIAAQLYGRRPQIASTSVCTECKRRGTVCVMVAHGTACLGPVTHAGCGAICPAYNRGCYGCFGPMETPNVGSLTRRLRSQGEPETAIDRVFHTFNTAVEPFASAGKSDG